MRTQWVKPIDQILPPWRVCLKKKRSNLCVNWRSWETMNNQSIVSDGTVLVPFSRAVVTTEERSCGSSRDISLCRRARTSSTTHTGAEMRCQSLTRRISRTRRPIRIMTKLKWEKTGKQRKSGGIIKVSTIEFLSIIIPFLGITDLTWAPDSLHFATCGTDSRICIMNINEGAPLKILDSKANGLTFDPFGKFLASQSSEEKSVKIWRVQNFKNITEATQISSYFKQSMGMSINRRLSWSSDGSFISATGGRIQGEYVVPLIERSSWNLMACLSGHSSSINISRINQRLYKYKEGADLNCYSIVAIVSQDSTISVWKPQLEKPFALIMDFSMMGVTDLSWGFNGNILLSSSHDGKVSAFHFQPGILGEPLSEFEKREIISRRYGNQVL